MKQQYYKTETGWRFVTDPTGESMGPFATKELARDARRDFLAARARPKIMAVVR